MLRILFLMSLLSMSACAAPTPSATSPAVTSPATRAQAPAPHARAPSPDAVLAPFEDAALMPPEVALLPYDRGRAYAVLVILPSPAIVDLSSPGRARRGLAGFLDPLAVQRAGTALGHVMVGWRCAGQAGAGAQAGLVSKTGAANGRGYRLLRQGWGMGAMLASYDDGRLVTLAELPDQQRRVMRAGRARILAMEITEDGCQRMRRALARYLAQPPAGQARYSMVPTQARPLGDGCAGFALCLTDTAGATGALTPWLMRSVELRDSFMGLGDTPEPGVTPLPTGARAPLSLLRLLLGDWSLGAEVGAVRLLDPELLQCALEQAGARAGYRFAERLPMEDPVNAAAQAAIARWLDGWHRVTPVRVGRAQAVVLHRR